MNSQPEVLLAIESAHLPHYTHSAVIVGSVVIVAIITLVAGVTLAIAHHLVSVGPMTYRDQSLRLHCIEKHEITGVQLGGDAGGDESAPLTGPPPFRGDIGGPDPRATR